MIELSPGWGFAANTFLRGHDGEIDEMLALGAAAEESGFDSLWIGDHILWHTPIVDGLTLLSAYAGTTKRIKLGSAILLLGLRQPAIGVKTVTSLNALAGGRLLLGVGVGGENPDEFEACGIPIKERGRRLDAALAMLRDQWTDGSDSPRFKPAGEPVPIIVGGRSDAARRRVIRFGDAWLHAFVSARRVAEETRRLNDETDRRPATALHVYVRTASSSEVARSKASEFLARVYAMPGEPLMRYAIAGEPRDCAEQLAHYVDAGVTHFVLRPAAWEQRGQLEDWAEHLLPVLPQLGAADSATQPAGGTRLSG
jgi:alkanesulfonate monooxygenase SsuD/methylene tetrahydromethanopterin reductase-like flavin-dependent oxidoreductase (luciferase family)